MSRTAIDLFCGAGGLSRGLQAAGFDIAMAFDAWEPATECYASNFPGHEVRKLDIGALTAKDWQSFGLPPLDLIAGGPPCQGFSIQRIGSDPDDRNDLVMAFARAVAVLRPSTFLMENVPGLLGKRGKATFDRFMSAIRGAGYTATHAILDAADYGVPQQRRRVFVVGWLAGAVDPIELPEPLQTPPMRVRDALGDLPPPPEDYSALPGDPLHRRMRISELNERRLQLIPPGGGFEDLPVELRINCHKQGASRIGHRAVYGRLDPERPASTITARFDSFTRGRFAHPWQHRNISLREGARLQGYPDSHQFAGTQEVIAALIGNSVPPPLAEAVAKSIAARLEGSRHRKAA